MIGAREGKPTAELRLGLGRDMRLTAPELAAAYEEGMIAEGATVLNAGQLPSSLLVGALPGRLLRRRWPLIAAGAIILLSVSAMSLGGTALVIAAGFLVLGLSAIFGMQPDFPFKRPSE